MQTWTDTVYCLTDDQQPHVTLLDEKRVAFHLPGYMMDGRGFSIYLSTAHLAAVEDLLLSLRTLANKHTEEETLTLDLDAPTLAPAVTPARG